MYKDLSLGEYWGVLKKRRRAATASFLIFFGGILFITYTATPVYKATARISIDSPFSQYGPERQPNHFDYYGYVQDQMGILRSEAVTREAVSRLRRKNADAAGDIALHEFMNRIVVKQPEKYSSLVSVSFESSDPGLAADFVNETVHAFMKRKADMKAAAAVKDAGLLGEELGRIKEGVAESSGSLEDFKESRGLLAGAGGQADILSMSLADLNLKLLAAEAGRREAEIKWRQAQELSRKPGGLMSLPEVMNNNFVAYLKARQGALASRAAELSKKYGEKNPQMVRLRNEMETLDGQVRREVDVIAGSIKNGYDEALESERRLRVALERERSETIKHGRGLAEYQLRRQDVEGARALYGEVLKQLRESEIIASAGVSNVRLIDKAVPPGKPVRPNKPLNIAIGLIFGIITAVSSAFVSERLDRTCTSPDEIERQLGLPVLGIVPKGAAREDGRPYRITAFSDPESPAAESFRTIRSNLLLARRDGGPRVIQVCSAFRAEGKSTVSANLACIMAAAGEKVLLVDADLRRPKLQSIFGLPNTRGLSSLLTMRADAGEVLRKTGVRNLSFIPAGPLCANPVELLGSARMLGFMDGMREEFGRVIIDCPPYMGLTDASVLTPLSDGVMLVVRSGKTARQAVLGIKKSMDALNVRILGVVLNGLAMSSLEQYYHYGYAGYLNNQNPADRDSSKKILVGALNKFGATIER